MAKAKTNTNTTNNTVSDAASKRHSTPYIFAGILLALVTFVNAVLVNAIAAGSSRVTSQTSRTMNTINRINQEMLNINVNVLSIMSRMGDNVQIASEINAHFTNVFKAMGEFEHIDGLSDDAVKRYNHAKAYINSYNASLNQLKNYWMQAAESGAVRSEAFQSNMRALYTQDIYPVQVNALEMLRACISIVGSDAGKLGAQNTRRIAILEIAMLLVAVAGEIAIFIIAKLAKRARIELEERERNLREVDAKLKNTRQKANDLAVINLLTNMKNRYALDNDVSERLESDRFNIAVFDMDNFRSINDTYGYDFGDEYLMQVADRLKEEFGKYAEIYNITGNEFCFLFNKEISESQAMGICQNIHEVMASPFNVMNLTVQIPNSGSVYHYLPGDCLNVNSLLVKLDTALRNAKMNGGNMINPVVDI